MTRLQFALVVLLMITVDRPTRAAEGRRLKSPPVEENPSAVASTGGAVVVHGNTLVSYRDIQSGGFTNLDGDGFRFDQANLWSEHQFTDAWRGYARITISGTALTLSEGYISWTGILPGNIPLEGTWTFGRFYKAGGEPFPLIDLSISQRIFHAFPDIGMKYNYERGPWSLELGLVNGNILTTAALSPTIAGSPALANIPTIGGLDVDNARDVYLHLAAREIETDFGAVSAGATFVSGKISPQEVDLLAPGGALDAGLNASTSNDDKRFHIMLTGELRNGPYHFRGEYVQARDGRLRRRILDFIGARAFATRLGPITARVGYGLFQKNGEREVVALPQTWDRDRWNFNLEWKPYDPLVILATYETHRENVKEPGTNANVKNNVLAMQAIASF